MSYTEGPVDQPWEVESMQYSYWVQRVGWNERNHFTKDQEVIFEVDTEEQAEALVARLNDLDRLRALEPALLLRFADALRGMTATVETAADGFIALEAELRTEAQRLTEERHQ